MALFQGIRDKWAMRELRRMPDNRRRRKVMNLHTSKDVGFIYISDSESKYLMIKQFAEGLRQEYGLPRIMMLGYIPEKEAPHYHVHKLNSDFFSQADLNWCGKPKAASYQQFVERDFDLLIDLSPGDAIPLRYVLNNSIAAFKVGRGERSEEYDMSIRLKEGLTLDAYMRQLERFLSRINHHEERQRV